MDCIVFSSSKVLVTIFGSAFIWLTILLSSLELDTLDKKVTELVLLNINLRKLNKRLQKDLTEKNSECQRLQKKIALSITSLKEIRQKFLDRWDLSRES